MRHRLTGLAALAALLALPCLMGCLVPFEERYPAYEPPYPFGFRCDTWVIAGSYGASWVVTTDPRDAPIRWHLEGEGQLLGPDRAVVDLLAPDPPHEGWYVPPAEVPRTLPEAKLWFEVYRADTRTWEKGAPFTLQIFRQSNPMSYTVATGSPTSASLVAGGKVAFQVVVTPRPLEFQQQVSLVSDAPAGQNPGSVVLEPTGSASWKVAYEAPAVVSSPFNVTVRCTAHDPWFNLDPILDFRVHVEP